MAKNIGQIAASAIETAQAIVNDTGEITKEQAALLLGALQSDLAEVWQPGDIAPIAEALTKTVSGRTHVKGDFLVVEDPEKPSTWYLPIKVNGKPDHRLMGAAKAALTVGYRGNKYEGPNKAQALSQLKALYKSEGMEFNEAVAELEAEAVTTWAVSFADLDAEQAARQVSSEVRELTYQFRDLVANIMFYAEVGDKSAAIRALTEEFTSRIDEVLNATPVESDPGEGGGADIAERLIALGEVADYDGDELAELDVEVGTGRRAPVVIDFRMIRPGPGNKRHNRYYPADILERDIHVFKGATVFTTDHKEKERSERTKVGKVLDVPTRFIERAPVAQVLIYDPDQAEKARNRADSGALDTLECSIYGTGTAREGEINGKTYNIVESITEGKYLELVSAAGAGGKALTLAEFEAGGDEMTNQEPVVAASEEESEVQEVSIEEAQDGATTTGENAAGEQAESQGASSEPQVLAEAEVTAALAESKLPARFHKWVKQGAYADQAALDAAIAEAIEDVKKLTGSGSPVGLGESGTVQTAQTQEEREAVAKDGFNAVMREVGLKEV